MEKKSDLFSEWREFIPLRANIVHIQWCTHYWALPGAWHNCKSILTLVFSHLVYWLLLNSSSGIARYPNMLHECKLWARFVKPLLILKLYSDLDHNPSFWRNRWKCDFWINYIFAIFARNGRFMSTKVWELTTVTMLKGLRGIL